MRFTSAISNVAVHCAVALSTCVPLSTGSTRAGAPERRGVGTTAQFCARSTQRVESSAVGACIPREASRVLLEIAFNPAATPLELATRCDLSLRDTVACINALLHAGLVLRESA